MADLGPEARQVADNFNKLNKATSELIESMRKHQQGESHLYNETAKSQTKVSDELERLSKNLKRNKDQLAKMQAEGITSGTRYARVQRAIHLGEEKKLKSMKSSIASSDLLSKGAGTVASKLVLFGTALSFVMKLVAGEYYKQLEFMEAYGGSIENVNDSLYMSTLALRGLGISYGISAVEFAKMTTAQRQTINALGGTAKAMNTLDGVFNNFAIMTGGDFPAAMKLALQQLNNFASLGIRPSSRAMQDFQKDVETLSKQTGMGLEQAVSFFDDIARDAESLVLLRSARAGERESILKSQRAMVQNAIAVGMSAEAAKEATKMLNKMVAAKPIDRMKQAARLRAMGGALGIAGSDEAARALIAGPRATAEQKQALMQFSQSATNMVDQMRGAGLGQEIFATQLLEKLDLEQYFGAGGTFSTTLGNVLAKPLSEVNQTMKAMSEMVDAQGVITARLIEMATREGISDPISFIKMISDNVGKIFDWVDKFFDVMSTLLQKLGGWIAKAFKSLLPSWIAGGEEAPTAAPQKPTGQENKALVTAVSSARDQRVVAAGIQDQNEFAKTTTKLQEQTATSSAGMLQSIQAQVNSLGQTNTLLEQLKRNSDEQLKLAEKQLAATLVSDTERSSPELRSRLLSDNRFYTQYGGVS